MLVLCLRAVFISSLDMWDWTRMHALMVMHRRTLCGLCQNKGAFLQISIFLQIYRYRYFTRDIDASYRHTLYQYIDPYRWIVTPLVGTSFCRCNVVCLCDGSAPRSFECQKWSSLELGFHMLPFHWNIKCIRSQASFLLILGCVVKDGPVDCAGVLSSGPLIRDWFSHTLNGILFWDRRVVAFEGNEGEIISIHLQRLNEEKRAKQSLHLMGNIPHSFYTFTRSLESERLVNAFKKSAYYNDFWKNHLSSATYTWIKFNASWFLALLSHVSRSSTLKVNVLH